MDGPDLTQLEEGSVFGISMYGRVRALAVVESVSNGVIIGRAVIGQYRIAFLAEEPRAGTFLARRAANWRDAETLNGSWAKGYEIGYAGELPEDVRDGVLNAAAAMRGMSCAHMKRAYGGFHEACREAIGFMNEQLDRVLVQPRPGM